MIEQLITDIEFVILDVLNVKVNLKQIEFQLFFRLFYVVFASSNIVYSEMFCQVIAGPALKWTLIVRNRRSTYLLEKIRQRHDPKKIFEEQSHTSPLYSIFGPRKLREAHSRRLLVTTAGRALIFSHTTESNYYETDESLHFCDSIDANGQEKCSPGNLRTKEDDIFHFWVQFLRERISVIDGRISW